MFSEMVKTLLILHTIFIMLTHPMSMILVIIPTTVIYAMMISKLMNTSWFSLILILILIGAMLILFLYMASLSPNELFNLPKYLPMILLLMLIPMPNGLTNNPMLNFNSYKLFSQIQLSTTIILTIYLLVTMITAVKITNINEGPLRST
uniref:NADH dehydrogenase subunit 6 n=1 Tax=Eremobates cf. palpisetulosus SEM-2008 TaxID=507470 RepID=B2CKF6_9ARAC|nr:NADH dehydrogenase subunit 6 [Eremobates cf. palpisetulosus SEM-2008]ACA49844.1 NADH dehydrogenase subunit 6 [Eremobates cf. palpisetulosus SEM-2008]